MFVGRRLGTSNGEDEMAARIAATVLTLALVAAGCSSEEASPEPLADSPPAVPAAQIDRADVDAAVGDLDGYVEAMMARTGTPGVAAAVVYQDEVLYSRGFGVRRVGTDEPVDTHTRFQLASVSKPVASSVIAASVGDGAVDWADPVERYEPEFAVADPYVSEHATFVDLLSHRSGLPDHAGDVLEDFGYDYDDIMGRLDQLPLASFRDSYAYTNFGFTAAGNAAAKAQGTDWPELSRRRIYEPLGMADTSSRFEDWANSPNHAVNHVLADGSTTEWEAKYVREPDNQSPAGGASSSVDDMTKWIRMELGGGEFEGRRIVDADALQYTHTSHSLSGASRTEGARDSFYGLGFNVGTDDKGRVELSHSGAFALGASTTVFMLPSEQLGIVVLSNSAPVGGSETVAAQFIDQVRNGRQTVDWAPLIAGIFDGIAEEEASPVDYATPPASVTPARPATEYVGMFDSPFHGPARVSADGDRLTLTVGKDGQLTYPLTHYDGDTYFFETSGENAVGPTGITFEIANGAPASFTVEYLDKQGLGRFTRS